MDKLYLDADKYDEVVDAYRSKNGYDDMSDEEKAAFDERLDKVVAIKEDEGDSSDDSDSTDESDDAEAADNRSDSDKLRDDLKSHYNYDDMSDEQKQAFDERLDEVVGQDSSDDEDPDQPEKVLVRTR